MTLIDNQIQDLFTFTRKHFVEWYDLQCELVDHLANDIEKIQTKHPNLSFEEARDKAFKKFGVFGFMNVVEAKSKALSKRYFKMVLREYKTFFTIPKILLTLSMIIGTILIFRFFNHNVVVIYTVILSVMAYTIIASVKYDRKIKRLQKQTGKKWLFQNMSNNVWMPVNLINFTNLFLSSVNNHTVQFHWGMTQEIIFVSILIVVCLFIYVSSVVIPPRFVEILSKEHPEYQLT